MKLNLDKKLFVKNRNYCLQLSTYYAKQKSYLYDLFIVYSIISEGFREVDHILWQKIQGALNKKDNLELLKNLLKLDLFSIKTSYIDYLKRDKTAIERKPQTVNRVCGRIYEFGLGILFTRYSKAK